MSQIGPLAHVVIQSVQLQRQMAVDKEQQLRRAQTVAKDVAAQEDEVEHQVESSEEVRPVNDEDQQKKQRQKNRGQRNEEDPEDDKPHIDLTA